MGEPWIRVHANLHSKPVVFRAVEALGVTRTEAVGLLVTFWGEASQHAANGCVGDYPDAQLEAWAGWERKRGKFAKFIREHHLDADGRVNEWDEYAGTLEEQRRQSRDRKRKSRGRHGDVTVTSSPTIRNDNDTILTAVEEGGEPAITAVFLSRWANGAITERWGEQPNFLTPASAHDLASVLNGMGIHWQAVKESIYRQCRNSKALRPPSSVNYFRRGVEEDWHRSQTRAALAAMPDQPPPMEGPSRPPPRGGDRPGIAQRAYDTTLAAIKDA